MSLGPDIVAAIAQRLAERVGLELPLWIIEARAAARISALGLTGSDYVALVESHRGARELDALVEAVRVGESRLFRHRAQIVALVDGVVPALRASAKRTIKVWSAGCSTGEEPYTLAAVLGRELPDFTISIVATDVSADALAVAKAARYSAACYADVPSPWRGAFELRDDVICVRPEVAALVEFQRANLVDGLAPRSCDLVWCRNVLIYFTQVARKRAIERLVAATSPGGCVFVGSSESLRDVRELHAVNAGDAVYYVRGEVPVRTPATRLHRAERPEPTPPPTRIPLAPPAEDVLVLHGQPEAGEVAAELAARLGLAGLRRLVVELDRAELLDDALVPVFGRARAAARAAQIELVLHATRAGTRRWLARHALAREAP